MRSARSRKGFKAQGRCVFFPPVPIGVESIEHLNISRPSQSLDEIRRRCRENQSTKSTFLAWKTENFPIQPIHLFATYTFI